MQHESTLKEESNLSSHVLSLLSPQFHSIIFPSIQQILVELTVGLYSMFLHFSLIKVCKDTDPVCHGTNANPQGCVLSVKRYLKRHSFWHFPRGPVVRLSAPTAGGLGSIPGQGTRSHMPQLRVYMQKLKIPHVVTKDPACGNEDRRSRGPQLRSSTDNK